MKLSLKHFQEVQVQSRKWVHRNRDFSCHLLSDLNNIGKVKSTDLYFNTTNRRWLLLESFLLFPEWKNNKIVTDLHYHLNKRPALSNGCYRKASLWWDRRHICNRIAHAWTSVILAGKRDSHRHSTTSFSANVVCWWREQVIKCMKFHHLAIRRELNLLQYK